MNHITKEMGLRLKKYRKKQFPDDTQKSFAFRLNINKNTLSAMENGQGNVGISHYLKAAELLGCEAQFEQLFQLPPVKKSLFDNLDEVTE